VAKIQEYLNRDRRNFMLTAHARRKTYEDFYKEKIAELITMYKAKLNLWQYDLCEVTKRQHS